MITDVQSPKEVRLDRLVLRAWNKAEKDKGQQEADAAVDNANRIKEAAQAKSKMSAEKEEQAERNLEKAEDKVTFDLILANILLPVLLSHISLISSVCREGSRVILSGILESQVEEMLESCNKVSLSLVSQSLKKDWACLELVKV